MNTENSESADLKFIPEVTDWTGAVRGMFADRVNSSYTEETIALFDDANRNYTKPALNAETTYSFYNRSSLDEFACLRQMLQRWVDRLPPAKQKDIVGRMRHTGRGSQDKQQSFDGAFLELFLHEFLNGTGGYTVVDPKIDDLTPDFGVTETGPDGTKINYVVEATDINYTRGTSMESNWNEQNALDALDEIESPYYYLWVETAGDLTRTPPKRQLKGMFENLVKNANYDDIRAIADLHGSHHNFMPSATFRYDDWSITGQLMPAAPERRPRKGRFIGLGPSKSGGVQDSGKVKTRLYDKAKHYRNVDNLIIALRADWWLMPISISETLFGSMAIQFAMLEEPAYDGPLPPPRTIQRRDGFWFNSDGPQNQHVIGVVAFHDLYPHCVDRTRAVFYANPYIDKPMPAWTKAVDHAEYDNGEVKIAEGLPPSAFVKDYEPRPEINFY